MYIFSDAVKKNFSHTTEHVISKATKEWLKYAKTRARYQRSQDNV